MSLTPCQARSLLPSYSLVPTAMRNILQALSDRQISPCPVVESRLYPAPMLWRLLPLGVSLGVMLALGVALLDCPRRTSSF